MFTSYFFYTGSWSSLASMNCSVNVQSSGFLQNTPSVNTHLIYHKYDNNKDNKDSSLPLLMDQ